MLKEENTKALEEDVVDISLPEIQKKRVRFDGDNSRICYVNASDLTVINRLEEVLPKLNKLAADAVTELSATDGGDEVDADKVGEVLNSIDQKMRDYIDYIFDAEVSKAAVPHGNMFNLHNGEFVFELVLNAVSKFYETNLNDEYKKLEDRLKKHTGKYTKSSKGKRK